MGNTKDRLKFRLRVVPHFRSGIVQWVKRKCAWKYIASPHARKAGHHAEIEKWGTRDKAFAFDFALLSQRITLIDSSMAICQKLSKMRQLLMTAQREKESHWMRLIHFKNDKNFILQNQSVSCEESKAWALSVVPHFSLSPAVSCLSPVGWYNVFSHAFAFCSLYYPWGNLRDYL